MKDHYARVKFPWIHEACHWTKEDPWRYYHSFSRPNESVGIAMELLVKKLKVASRRAPSSSAAKGNITTRDKGKINIVDNAEAE